MCRVSSRTLIALCLSVLMAECQRIVVSPNYPFQVVCCRPMNNNIYNIPNYAFNVPAPRMPSMPRISIGTIKSAMPRESNAVNMTPSIDTKYTNFQNRIHVQDNSTVSQTQRIYPRTYPYSRIFFNRNLKRGAPIVTTALGSISGRLITTKNRFRMLAYLGIPYAERPVRFQRANPRRSFGRGIFDSSKYGPTCPMATLTSGGVVTLKQNSSEDCLFLKILAPEQRNQPLPVLFWIHGGGFVAGSNQESDLDALGDNILSKGVIIAQPNYRLGPFGFWSSLTEDAEGNYALWDVLTALQFVHREITAFGGDPNRIFLMGQGAGAILAEALSLSPLARGLFSGMIQLSGTAFDPRVNLPERAEEAKYKRFVQSVGCDDTNGSSWKHDLRRKNVVLCLRQKNVLQLLQAQSDAKLMNSLDWHPRVDGRGGILPQSFEKLARIRPTYPVLMGSTADETSWDMIVSPLINEYKSRSLTENIKPILTLPTNIFNMNSAGEVEHQCDKIISESLFLNAGAVREKCHRTFIHDVIDNNNADPFPPMSLLGRAFTNKKPEENNPYFWLKQAVAVSSSFYFHAPIMKSLGYHLANGNRNIYLYSLDYERVQDGQWWEVVGAFHNLDIALIEEFFPSDLYRFKADGKDTYVKNILTDCISSFVETGIPRITNGDPWKPMRLGSHDYYSISLPVSMKSGFHDNFVAFWNEVVPSVPQKSMTTETTTTIRSTVSSLTPWTATELVTRIPLIPRTTTLRGKYYPSMENMKPHGIKQPSGISGLIPNPYFPYKPPPKPASGPIPMPNILPFKPPSIVTGYNKIEQLTTTTNLPIRTRLLPRIYPIYKKLTEYTTDYVTSSSATYKPITYTSEPATTKLIPIYVPSSKPSELHPKADPDLFTTSLEWIKNFLPPILSSLRGNDGVVQYNGFPGRGMVQYKDGFLNRN